MHKESLETRIAELRGRQQQLLNEANACEGAILDCQHWLTVIEEGEKKTDDG